MGFRFRKTIRIAPGVRLNLSKSGVSTSIGRPGATINLGKRGVRGTVGLPGTGLSYSEMLSTRELGASAPDGRVSSGGTSILKICFVIIVAVLAAWMIFGRSPAPRESVGATSDKMAPVAAMDESTTQPAASTATVMTAVNCRVSPQKKAPMVEMLTEGDTVSIVGKKRNWSEVTTASGRCWVVSDYIG